MREHAQACEHIVQAVSYNLLTLYSNNPANLTLLEDEHCFLPTLLLALPATKDEETVSAVCMNLNYTCQSVDGMMAVIPIIAVCACMATLVEQLFANNPNSPVYHTSMGKLDALCAALLDVVRNKYDYGNREP